MPWSLTDDKLHADPRRFDAGLEAMGLFAIARTWIADLLMDGFIPRGVALSLAGGKDAVIQRLVDAGFWTTEGEGYRDVDYLVANQTRAEVEKRRATMREQRVKAGLARATKATRQGGQFTSGDASDAPAEEPANDQRSRWSRGGSAQPASHQPQSQSQSPGVLTHTSSAGARDGTDAADRSRERDRVLEWLVDHGYEADYANATKLVSEGWSAVEVIEACEEAARRPVVKRPLTYIQAARDGHSSLLSRVKVHLEEAAHAERRKAEAEASNGQRPGDAGVQLPAVAFG